MVNVYYEKTSLCLSKNYHERNYHEITKTMRQDSQKAGYEA